MYTIYTLQGFATAGRSTPSQAPFAGSSLGQYSAHAPCVAGYRVLCSATGTAGAIEQVDVRTWLRNC